MKKPQKIKLSLNMVLYNEEKYIKECLEDIKDFVDEIVIVIDSKTIDKTHEICKKYTDKIYFDTASCCEPLRPLCVKKSKGEWLLILDADEKLDKEAKQAIKNIINNDIKENGFFLKRKEIIFNKHLLTTWQLRLYRKDKVNYSLIMHEVPEISGKTSKASGHIMHYAGETFSTIMNKCNKQTTIAAKELLEEKDMGIINIFFHMFVESSKYSLFHFLYRGLIFKGIPGWIYSFQAWFHYILIYLKYYELKYVLKQRGGNSK